MERGSNPRQEAHPLPLSLSPEGDSFSAASPPPPPPPPQQGQEEGQQERWRARISYRVSVSINSAALSAGTLDDVCSCLVVLVTFCFFASMSLILGFYGSADLVLGPNSSRLLGANSFFVQDIKVKTAGAVDSGPGPVLYGFSNPPPLDINTTWTQNHSASIPANSHREWIYYLNGGAQIDISYRVMKSQGGESSPLTLVIAQGKESIIQWIEEPSYPNSTLSWYSIHGNGLVQQKIVKPSDYYVAVGNLNRQKVEVILNFRVQAFLYNTTGAYYKCALHDGLCVLKLFFLRSDVAILATSVPEQDGERDEWYVKMSYGPRWITYFVGSGGMTIIMLLAFKVMTRSQSISGDAPNSQDAEVVPERTPLLTNKDDDTSSLGSSYDSVSHDEEDIEEWLRDAPPSAKSLKGDEIINSRCLCAICFDAPVDCFFLPCGHCATCFPCGLRTIEEARTCPICSRKMKKVRKVLAV